MTINSKVEIESSDNDSRPRYLVSNGNTDNATNTGNDHSGSSHSSACLESDFRRSRMIQSHTSFSSNFLNVNELGSFSDGENEILENDPMQTLQEVELSNSRTRKCFKSEKRPPSGISDKVSTSCKMDPEPDIFLKDDSFSKRDSTLHPISGKSQMNCPSSGGDFDCQTYSFRETETGHMSPSRSSISQSLSKYVDSSIEILGSNPGFRKNHYATRKRIYIIALFFLVGISFFLTILSQYGTNHSKDDVKPESRNDFLTQQNNKTKAYTSLIAINDAFDTAHQIVIACIEKSNSTTRSCAEMCESKRCCFEEFNCPTIMTQRECSVYAGCLSWLREERYLNKENQVKKAIDDIMNKTEYDQSINGNIWTDSGGRQFSANLLLEACNENNIKTQYGHDNCSYLCQQSICCFISSSLESCSNEKARCQVFSPCEKAFFLKG